MTRKNVLGPQIQQLRDEGHSFKQIKQILQCSLSTVCYHLSDGQKLKTRIRSSKNLSLKHPYHMKIANFSRIPTTVGRVAIHHNQKLLYDKVLSFFRNRDTKMYHKPTFTVEDVINKFGETPQCYITGLPIDISKPRTYHFDHIIPTSKGGQTTLDNLGICTKQANLAKGDMTPDEFINFCKLVIAHNQAAS